jgi:antitoxin MazE
MKSKLQKWGNSLAVRIPKSLVEEADIKQGSDLKLNVVNKKIIIEPTKESSYTLMSLLKRITKDNTHSEIESGKPKGNEVW